MKKFKKSWLTLFGLSMGAIAISTPIVNSTIVNTKNNLETINQTNLQNINSKADDKVFFDKYLEINSDLVNKLLAIENKNANNNNPTPFFKTISSFNTIEGFVNFYNGILNNFYNDYDVYKTSIELTHQNLFNNLINNLESLNIDVANQVLVYLKDINFNSYSNWKWEYQTIDNKKLLALTKNEDKTETIDDTNNPDSSNPDNGNQDTTTPTTTFNNVSIVFDITNLTFSSGLNLLTNYINKVITNFNLNKLNTDTTNINLANLLYGNLGINNSGDSNSNGSYTYLPSTNRAIISNKEVAKNIIDYFNKHIKSNAYGEETTDVFLDFLTDFYGFVNSTDSSYEVDFTLLDGVDKDYFINSVSDILNLTSKEKLLLQQQDTTLSVFNYLTIDKQIKLLNTTWAFNNFKPQLVFTYDKNNKIIFPITGLANFGLENTNDIKTNNFYNKDLLFKDYYNEILDEYKEQINTEFTVYHKNTNSTLETNQQKFYFDIPTYQYIDINQSLTAKDITKNLQLDNYQNPIEKQQNVVDYLNTFKNYFTNNKVNNHIDFITNKVYSKQTILNNVIIQTNNDYNNYLKIAKQTYDNNNTTIPNLLYLPTFENQSITMNANILNNLSISVNQNNFNNSMYNKNTILEINQLYNKLTSLNYGFNAKKQVSTIENETTTTKEIVLDYAYYFNTQKFIYDFYKLNSDYSISFKDINQDKVDVFNFIFKSLGFQIVKENNNWVMQSDNFFNFSIQDAKGNEIDNNTKNFILVYLLTNTFGFNLLRIHNPTNQNNYEFLMDFLGNENYSGNQKLFDYKDDNKNSIEDSKYNLLFEYTDNFDKSKIFNNLYYSMHNFYINPESNNNWLFDKEHVFNEGISQDENFNFNNNDYVVYAFDDYVFVKSKYDLRNVYGVNKTKFVIFGNLKSNQEQDYKTLKNHITPTIDDKTTIIVVSVVVPVVIIGLALITYFVAKKRIDKKGKKNQIKVVKRL